MAEMSTIRKRRSVITGVLLVLLGVWGGLAPFVGPYFHYAYTPDTTWHYTQARLWLEVLPAGAAVVGGALVMVSTSRLLAACGAVLAVLAGGWFIVGTMVNTIWARLGTPGVPAGTTHTRIALEQLGLFTGLGVVIVFCAALALGRAAATASHAGSDLDAYLDADAEEDTEAEAMAGRFRGGKP
jgi:hypothetical protein